MRGTRPEPRRASRHSLLGMTGALIQATPSTCRARPRALPRPRLRGRVSAGREARFMQILAVATSGTANCRPAGTRRARRVGFRRIGLSMSRRRACRCLACIGRPRPRVRLRGDPEAGGTGTRTDLSPMFAPFRRRGRPRARADAVPSLPLTIGLSMLVAARLAFRTAKCFSRR